MKKLLREIIDAGALRECSIRFNSAERMAEYGYDVIEIESLRRQYRTAMGYIDVSTKAGQYLERKVEQKMHRKFEKVILREFLKLTNWPARMDFQTYIRHLSHEIPSLNRIWPTLYAVVP